MCSELLAGALARLGKEVYSLSPDITDREDEDELNKHFNLILANRRAGQLSRLRQLNPSDHVFPYFIGNSNNFLLVALKERITEETVTVSGMPVNIHSSSGTVAKYASVL